jgi:hypothetical protein
MLWIQGYGLVPAEFRQPYELGDRTPRRREDRRLDRAGLALHEHGRTLHQRDLRSGGVHVAPILGAGRWLGLAEVCAGATGRGQPGWIGPVATASSAVAGIRLS